MSYGHLYCEYIATFDSWKDKLTGERQYRTEWHHVVVFNPNIADVCEKYLRKGAKVYIEGQLQTRKWTDQTGQEKCTTEIVLPKFKGELTMLDGRSEAENPSPTLGYMSAVNPTETSADNSLSDLPF